MKPAPFDYACASSLDEAMTLLAGTDGDIRPLSGGQSMGPMLNFRLARPALLVDISRIKELTTVSEDADGVTVGAAVTHAAFEDGDVADVANGLIRHAASGIAYRAVRIMPRETEHVVLNLLREADAATAIVESVLNHRSHFTSRMSWYITLAL